MLPARPLLIMYPIAAPMRQPTPFIPAPEAATAAMPNGPAEPSSLADAKSTPPIRCTTA